jgi:hypothetical protein
VTVRDVLVQIGFLMVTAGAMLLVWAVATGQFSRVGPEAIPAEPADVPQPIFEPEPESERVVVPSRRASPPRARTAAAKRVKPKPKSTSKSAVKAKPRPRKPRPPA